MLRTHRNTVSLTVQEAGLNFWVRRHTVTILELFLYDESFFFLKYMNEVKRHEGTSVDARNEMYVVQYP